MAASRVVFDCSTGVESRVRLDPAQVAQRTADETEAAAAAVARMRAERDRRIAACDWTQATLADSPLTAEQVRSWAAYRQALRDLTAADPSDPAWPTPPA